MKPPSTMAAKTTATPRRARSDMTSILGGSYPNTSSPPVMAVTQLLQGRYRAWAALTLAVS